MDILDRKSLHATVVAKEGEQVTRVSREQDIRDSGWQGRYAGAGGGHPPKTEKIENRE